MLSYGALAGIMSAGKIIKILTGKFIFPRLSSKLAESAGAQFLTAPVCVHLWGKFMPGGIISTVFVSPLVILFLYTGLAGTVLCLLMPFLSGPFNDIMNLLYKLIYRAVKLFAHIPAVTV